MKKQINTKLEEALQTQLKVACTLRGISIEEALDQAVRNWLGHDDPEAEMAARFLKWMKAKNHGPVEQKLKGWVVDCLTPGALPDPDPE